MQTIEEKIKSRIYGHGRGWVFTPKDFLDLGSRGTIGSALTRLTQSGFIRSLARGLYDYPKIHPQIGQLLPPADAIAKALVGSAKIRIQPSGAYAANLLGLSEQLPLKIVFLTDGPYRTIRVGKQEIILRRTTPKNMSTAGTISGLVIQALKHLGKENVGDEILLKLRNRLAPTEKERLLKDISLAPSWIGLIIKKIGS